MSMKVTWQNLKTDKSNCKIDIFSKISKKSTQTEKNNFF